MEKRVCLRLFTAAASLLAASAANAGPVAPASLGAVSLAKTNAILGGAPSALAEVMARQQGIALPAPASRAVRLAVPAMLRRDVEPPAALRSGRPDVFGTVALAVSRTPLDTRWRKAEAAAVGGSHASWARSLKGFEPAERADFVNRFVNNRVRFVDDERQHGRPDVWSTASETLRRGKGDCEDYAIAKLQLLRQAGFSDRDLYLVVLKDLVRREDHAVLVVRAGDRMLMLDNGSDELLDPEQVSDYRPILTFAAGGSWTHGYRRKVPDMNVAAAGLASDQRSRSASLLALSTGFNR